MIIGTLNVGISKPSPLMVDKQNDMMKITWFVVQPAQDGADAEAGCKAVWGALWRLSSAWIRVGHPWWEKWPLLVIIGDSDDLWLVLSTPIRICERRLSLGCGFTVVGDSGLLSMIVWKSKWNFSIFRQVWGGDSNAARGPGTHSEACKVGFFQTILSPTNSTLSGTREAL